jgi:hypothetical protein
LADAQALAAHVQHAVLAQRRDQPLLDLQE